MLLNLAIILAVMLILFLVYVGTRSSQFRYERSDIINASAEKIFPYLSDFKLGAQWSSYEKTDPNMKKIFSGFDGQVGSVMEFDGNREAGSGKLEMLKIIPFREVHIQLTMIKPIFTKNLVQYLLTPEAGGTRFTWIMSGDGGYMAKLVNVVIDCEKMTGDLFTQGISNLKNVVENQK